MGLKVNPNKLKQKLKYSEITDLKISQKKLSDYHEERRTDTFYRLND